MTMQCHTIQPNATPSWNPEMGVTTWEGENTITFGARDDVTNEDQFLTVPFDPQVLSSPGEITPALHGVIEPAEPGYVQRFNNVMWAWAVTLDQNPEAILVWADGQLQVRVNGGMIGHIDTTDAQFHSD